MRRTSRASRTSCSMPCQDDQQRHLPRVVADLRDARMPQDDESVTDHSTPVKHVEDVPDEWTAMMPARMVHRCIAEMVKSTGSLEVDSSAKETTP